MNHIHKRVTVAITDNEERALRRVFQEKESESLSELIIKAMRDGITVEETKAMFGRGKYILKGTSACLSNNKPVKNIKPAVIFIEFIADEEPMFVASSNDIHGITCEAYTLDALKEKLAWQIPEMISLNHPGEFIKPVIEYGRNEELHEFSNS